MIVLKLAPDTYYVAPRDSCSNFGCVGIPWMATEFMVKNEEVLSQVRGIFKGAKYIRVEVTYKIIDEA